MSEASQKPPLRPEAPNASRSPSSSTTDFPSSAACSAVHRPVSPPPTTRRSASTVPARGGRRAGAPARSSQNGTVAGAKLSPVT